MLYALVGSLALLAIVVLRLRRPPVAPAPVRRWAIVARRGPLSGFSCGHRGHRRVAYSCGGGVSGLFIRKIPKWMAREVPCADCVLARLEEKTQADASGFERLVPIKDLLDGMSDQEKDRLN